MMNKKFTLLDESMDFFTKRFQLNFLMVVKVTGWLVNCVETIDQPSKNMACEKQKHI